MAAPTLNSVTSSNYTTAAGTNETVTISWSAGDVIVVVGLTSSENFTLGLPTATGLTFSQIASSTISGNDDTIAKAWAATAAGAGSGVTVTSAAAGGSAARGITAFVYSGSDGTGATAAITNSTAKTISLTRTQANSAVIVALADWNATSDVTVTSTPSAGATQRIAQTNAAEYTVFVIDWADEGATGTTSYGIASHTGTVDMSGVVVEIKGTASAGATGRTNHMTLLGVR